MCVRIRRQTNIYYYYNTTKTTATTITTIEPLRTDAPANAAIINRQHSPSTPTTITVTTTTASIAAAASTATTTKTMKSADNIASRVEIEKPVKRIPQTKELSAMTSSVMAAEDSVLTTATTIATTADKMDEAQQTIKAITATQRQHDEDHTKAGAAVITTTTTITVYVFIARANQENMKNSPTTVLSDLQQKTSIAIHPTTTITAPINTINMNSPPASNSTQQSS
uniref:Uncharacterized protein n=1 Tax=Ceratitis capitata TaxID=7213 RepID=W8BSN1_CERCA